MDFSFRVFLIFVSIPIFSTFGAVDAKVHYIESSTTTAPLPCTDMIHWSQSFSDVQSVVNCTSKTSDASVVLKVNQPGEFAYFNPYDYDKDSVLWECVARLTFPRICARFNAWASPEHALEICDGAHSCHQCKWFGVQYDILLDSEQCFEKSDPDISPADATLKSDRYISPAAAATREEANHGPLYPCYQWRSEPC